MSFERMLRGVVTAICVFMFLEGLSWFTAPIPPCLITEEDGPQATAHDDQKDCPTFYAGSKILLARLDHFIESHDKSIIAGFTVVLALSTIGLWLATVRLWEAGERQMELIANNAGQQAQDMRESIVEAGRAATAMERVAGEVARSAQAAIESVATVKDATSRQMRAYLVANFGAVVEQDRTTNYRFEIRLLLVNTGHTPAYAVGYKAHADVLPFPLPADFAFVLPDRPAGSASTLGSGHNFIMAGVVDRMCSDDELVEIKDGGAKRLYIYGTATYQDAFGVERYTNFCQSVAWYKNGTSIGHYTLRHNDAN